MSFDIKFRTVSLVAERNGAGSGGGGGGPGQLDYERRLAYLVNMTEIHQPTAKYPDWKWKLKDGI